ncbi:Kinesin light chain 1 [Coniochaeta hoffmannii]|uniref:Kinesin light chain 1 n=1 Tax=Coniochaeta hoffmannii TaxID=91930 RepID=A0AA38R3V8_9PEZI|nr:Kinesin light chain 1 [Coniochaeta hoffmannii]
MPLYSVSPKQTECPSVALTGLGGVGKTQVALPLAFWTKENKADWSVFWVPALSAATFEQAYTDIARRLGITRGDDQDVKECVQQYLSLEAAGRWLLVVDNADDAELMCGSFSAPQGLDSYLPQSENGRIVFTTRSRDIAVRVAEETVKLDEFNLSETKRLLERLVTRKDLIDDAAVTELLQELTYLPPAITQAAAYLERNEVSIAEYLRLLRNTEKDMESTNAVAATWVVSIKKMRDLDHNAADLLSFMSQIEPKSIPQSLLPELDSKVQTVRAIGTLCGYAFVSKLDDMLDMHTYQADGQIKKAVALLEQAVAVQGRTLAEDHPSRLASQHALAGAYQSDGQIKKAVALLEQVVTAKERTLTEDHPSRLASQCNLAIAYQADGRMPQAAELLKQVVAVELKMSEEDHPDRLASLSALENVATSKALDIHRETRATKLAVQPVIPFPRNEDVVDRDVFAALDRLLPSATPANYQSAALWGPRGVWITLQYAYRRSRDPACSVFWVHANDETTFTKDCKTIANRLGLAGSLDGPELLAAVRKRIEANPCWALILDNADNLAVFGVGRTQPGEEEQRGLYDFVLRGPAGTSLVGARRAMHVGSMTERGARTLLEAVRDKEVGEAAALLAELERLPLAVSQAAAYMCRTSTPIDEYLSRLRSRMKRWEVLGKAGFDRHRRGQVSNSVLQTWHISIERVREENKVACDILHALAYVDNQTIPFALVAKAAATMDRPAGNREATSGSAAGNRDQQEP